MLQIINPSDLELFSFVNTFIFLNKTMLIGLKLKSKVLAPNKRMF